MNNTFGNDPCAIAELTDDCLREIFKRLPIRDRLTAERVCRRWRAISVRGWPELKEWHMTDFAACEDDGIAAVDAKKLTLDEFAVALRRCGPYLTKASFTVNPCQAELLRIFNDFCHCLEELTFWLPAESYNPERIEDFLRNMDDLFEDHSTIKTAVIYAEIPEKGEFISYTVRKSEGVEFRRGSLSSKIRVTVDLLSFSVNFILA